MGTEHRRALHKLAHRCVLDLSGAQYLLARRGRHGHGEHIALHATFGWKLTDRPGDRLHVIDTPCLLTNRVFGKGRKHLITQFGAIHEGPRQTAARPTLDTIYERSHVGLACDVALNEHQQGLRRCCLVKLLFGCGLSRWLSLAVSLPEDQQDNVRSTNPVKTRLLRRHRQGRKVLGPNHVMTQDADGLDRGRTEVFEPRDY